MRTEKDFDKEASLPPLNLTRIGGSSRTFCFIHPDKLGLCYHKTDLATSKKKSIFDGVYPVTSSCPTVPALLALSIDRIIVRSDTKSTAVAAVPQRLNHRVFVLLENRSPCLILASTYPVVVNRGEQRAVRVGVKLRYCVCARVSSSWAKSSCGETRNTEPYAVLYDLLKVYYRSV